MDCIDVGHDYFLIKFELQADLESVLRGGPWFVGSQFLAITQTLLHLVQPFPLWQYGLGF